MFVMQSVGTPNDKYLGDDIDENQKCSRCHENDGMNIYPVEDENLCANCLILEHMKMQEAILEIYKLKGKFPTMSKKQQALERTYGEYIENWPVEVGL